MCLRVNGAQTASTRACVYCMYAKTHALIIRTRYGRARDNYRLLKLFGDWARERSLCQHTHLQRALLCPGLQTQSSSLSYSLSACAYLVCHPAPHRPLPPCLTHTHTRLVACYVNDAGCAVDEKFIPEWTTKVVLDWRPGWLIELRNFPVAECAELASWLVLFCFPLLYRNAQN